VSGTPFRARAALSDLPKGAERAIIEQFRQVQSVLDTLQGVERNATPVLNTPGYLAKPGELVLVEGIAGGTLVTIPAGSSANIEQTIRVALVGGVLSPGVTIAIVGRQGTISGAQTVTMTSLGMVELTSVGSRGWTMVASGGGGGVSDGVYGSITVSGGGTIWRLTDGVYGGVTVSGGGLIWTPTGGAVSMTDATITVPYGAHSATANVVDANILVGSRVGIFWGTVLASDVNEPEMDDVSFTCTPAAGSMTVRVSSDKSPVGGPYKIRYLIG
jgi:hypothetical protein